MRLLLLLLLAAGCCCERSSNQTAARIWFDKFDKELAVHRFKSSSAAWNNAVNITKENGQLLTEADISFANFTRSKAAEMRMLFDWTKFTDKNLTRLFEKASDVGTGIANETMQKTLSQLLTRLGEAYNTAVVSDPISGKPLRLDADLVPLLADPNVSENYKRQLWTRWRDASGRQMRHIYPQFVATINSMIQEAGYRNTAHYWQSLYEPRPEQNFEKMMEQMWDSLLPLYKQLHAYVRRKLRHKYGDDIFPPTGQIPAHILGNMWAQSWRNTEKDTSPFPGVSTVDISAEMRRQNWTANRMVRVSEEFFTSIGLLPMTDSFWKKSVFEQIPNVEMACHASAWDFSTGNGDFRIKQCTAINTAYLGTTHHEMGHIQYYQQYEHQPVLFRRGANSGFHEAIGDTMELSVLTPEHLKLIGLLNETMDSKEYYLNYLFQMSLSKLAFIPFGYLIDRWRWRAFDGSVKPEHYNKLWWQLRCELQGVASPVKRGDNDFDPGAKYHVPSNTPYIRYFVSYVLQFQFYEALCKAAKHTGPLYKCDFYKSREAGQLMEKLMKPGSSKHWEDILEEATGTREVSVEPLKRYFSDLEQYLRDENQRTGERVGWDAACPSDDWYDRGSSPLSKASIWLTAVTVLFSFLCNFAARVQ